MQPESRLDSVFFALSDRTRRAILSRLAQGSTTIGRLSEPFPISAPAISKHVKILERAGLIERKVTGREHHCSLATGGLKTAEDWIAFHRQFWESRLDALDELFRSNKHNEKEQ